MAPRSVINFRCTRPDMYTANCPGRTNPRARQGHYVHAQSAKEAREIMNKDYPGEKIDVEIWEVFDENGKVVYGRT